MRATFDRYAEQELLNSYLAHLPRPDANLQGERIGRISDDFRRLRLGESILMVAHTTEWIVPWFERVGRHLRAPVRSSRIEALGRWWAWLFQHTLLDDNVLGCFYPCSQVLRQQQPIVLCQNLQRPIACYLDERGPRQPLSRLRKRRLLTNFNVFLHRGRTESTTQPLIDEARTIAWLRHLSATRCLNSVAIAATITNGFLRFLVAKRSLDENPLMRLRRQYSASRWEDFLAGLLGLQDATLTAAIPRPRFVSFLAPQLAAFVDLKRALGRRYQTAQQSCNASTASSQAALVGAPNSRQNWWTPGPNVVATSSLQHAAIGSGWCVNSAGTSPGKTPRRTYRSQLAASAGLLSARHTSTPSQNFAGS